MGKTRLWDIIRNWKFVAKLAREGGGVAYQEAGSLLVCLRMVPAKEPFSVPIFFPLKELFYT